MNRVLGYQTGQNVLEWQVSIRIAPRLPSNSPSGRLDHPSWIIVRKNIAGRTSNSPLLTQVSCPLALSTAVQGTSWFRTYRPAVDNGSTRNVGSDPQASMMPEPGGAQSHGLCGCEWSLWTGRALRGRAAASCTCQEEEGDLSTLGGQMIKASSAHSLKRWLGDKESQRVLQASALAQVITALEHVNSWKSRRLAVPKSSSRKVWGLEEDCGCLMAHQGVACRGTALPSEGPSRAVENSFDSAPVHQHGSAMYLPSASAAPPALLLSLKIASALLGHVWFPVNVRSFFQFL